MSRSAILYVTPSGERGGAEAALRTILQSLDRTRFEPVVICLEDGSFVKELRDEGGLSVDIVPAGRFRNLRHAQRVIRDLRTFIGRHGIRLVHANGTGAHLYAGTAAWLCGVPNIYHLHDVLDLSRTRQGLLHRLALLAPATATVAVSRYVAERVPRHPRRPRAVHVIHNAVSPPAAPATLALPRTEWGWPAESLLVVWCGRLQRWKGAHVFLEAAARVRRDVPAARFLVVGGALFGLEAAYEGELHALARGLGLGEDVRFTGQQADPGPFLAAADVIVHSSVCPEAFGLVVLEGMAHGKPVVASAAGGPEEIVEPGVTGRLVPPNDADALAQALITLMRDDSLRAEMGRAARERAERCFSVGAMMRRIETLYGELLGNAPTFHSDQARRWTV